MALQRCIFLSSASGANAAVGADRNGFRADRWHGYSIGNDATMVAVIRVIESDLTGLILRGEKPASFEL